MEKTYKRVPFDIELAKKIQAGEIEGKIKTRDSKDVDEIVLFRTPLEYNVYAVINGIPHSFTERGFERSWDKSGKWHGDLVIEVPDNEPQFKPFDKVLVRDHDKDIWRARIYDYYAGSYHFCQDGHGYNYCIPYEGNEQLACTTNKPKDDFEPEEITKGE